MPCDPLTVNNIIEIELIKDLILKHNPEYIVVFNYILKIANKAINNEKLEHIIETIISDSDSEPSLYSDSSDENV